MPQARLGAAHAAPLKAPAEAEPVTALPVAVRAFNAWRTGSCWQPTC